jgi:methionyl-tRNA formyltransferase
MSQETRMGMKLIFLGTPEFAVPTLDALVAAGHNVLEVVTQPDRPKGRRQELTPTPVKLAALRHDLKVFQPARIRHADSVAHLRALAPDAMVIVGYGQIIPQSIIDIAPLGVINVHASLLPELRGAAPIQWSIVRGHEKTGVTTMRIDAGLDTGDIAMKWETPVDPDETAPELSPRLASAGADLLLQTLNGLADETVKPVPQDNYLATWAPILKKEDGRIDWTLPAKTIHNLIRGLQPWPGAFTMFRGQSLHLWRSRLVATKWNLAPGALVRDEGVFAVAGDGAALQLLELQLEGRKRMPAEVFANGHRITTTEQLGK